MLEIVDKLLSPGAAQELIGQVLHTSAQRQRQRDGREKEGGSEGVKAGSGGG
jgi:hypothetical protein